MRHNPDDENCTQCNATLGNGLRGLCEVCQNHGSRVTESDCSPMTSPLSDQDNIHEVIYKVIAASACVGLIVTLNWLWMNQEFLFFAGVTGVFGPATLHTLFRIVANSIRGDTNRSMLHYGSNFLRVLARTALICAITLLLWGIIVITLLFSIHYF